MKIITIISIILTLSQAVRFRQHPESINEVNDSGKVNWFDQLVDHTRPLERQTFKQRIFIYDQFFDAQKGAVILYICGEWTCNGLGASTYALTLAEQYHAMVITLEHRFYGESQPFGDASLSESNLQKFLSVQQALDDIAYFITIVKKNGLYGVTNTLPWLHIGGSYPGGLSAWFRYKYPHLTLGGLASSAVVHPILDFTGFDQQIHDSALKSGQECVQAIQDVTALAEKYMGNLVTRNMLLNTFGAQGYNTGEFFFFFADISVQQIQYGKRTQFCNSLKGKTIADQLEVFRRLGKALNIQEYSSSYLKNTTHDKDKNARQWYFQTCNEVGWMQSAPKTQSMRSQSLNLGFWQQWCMDSFGMTQNGVGVWPNVENTNAYFGGLDLNVKNLIMTNGSEDPWKRASIYQPRVSDITIIEIDCNDCGHCQDTKAPKDSDPQQLKDARTKISQLFGQWITEHYASIQKKINQ